MSGSVEKIGCPACGPDRPPSQRYGTGCEQCEGAGWVYQVPDNLDADEVARQIKEIEQGEADKRWLTRWRLSNESGIPITVTQPDDPAYKLLQDDYTSTPVVHKTGCYICEDPEFAQMGLPLCRKCSKCGGHIPADDCVCDDCGYDEMEEYEEYMEQKGKE